MAIKKSDEKKMKSIEPGFYLDALNSEKFSVEDYGLDRRRLGRALGKILRNYGAWFNTSDRYCFMIVNHMEDAGLIKATVDRFVVVSNWREILQEMFPKVNLEALELGRVLEEEHSKSEAPVAEAAQEITQDESASSVPMTQTSQKVEIRSLKDNYEFYSVLLERMGEDFRTQDELKKIISELYQENFGEPHNYQYYYNKVRFFLGAKILESIEDEGVIKYLRAKDYKDLLEARKDFLKRSPYEFKPQQVSTEPVTVELPEPVKISTEKEEKKQVQPQVPVLTKPKDIVCVCIDPTDLTKLYETEVLFNDGHKCIVLLETIPANIDVLKNIKAEADPKSQNQLWDYLADQREFYLSELAKITRLCGKRA